MPTSTATSIKPFNGKPDEDPTGFILHSIWLPVWPPTGIS